MGSDVISEEELQKKGVKYIKNEEGTNFYIEKTNLDKFKDYTYRALGTPFTVVFDAAIVVVIVGLMIRTGEALKGFLPSGNTAEEKKGLDRKENDSNVKNK